jgi:hypothetical protein
LNLKMQLWRIALRHLRSLVGGALSAALVLAGASSSFAASAVQHPAPIVASKVEGSIIVAKKNKNKIGAIIGGAILGAAILGAAANANADERARDRDDDDYDDRRRSSRRDDDYNDRPRRRARRSGGGYARCADAFKSFRESDGTYQPYDRDYRVRCPYL